MAWVTPFAHVLFGAAQVSVNVTPTGPHASETAFAAAAGAGVDLNLGSKAAIRVLQVQYSPMNQVAAKNDKVQASAGIVIHLGKTK